MSAASQEPVVFAVVALTLAVWALKLSSPLWLEPVSRWLLARGHVALAMRLRFGKRRR